MRSSCRSGMRFVLCTLLVCALAFTATAQTISVSDWSNAVSTGRVILTGNAATSGATLVRSFFGPM
jgi:uncharacterized transporter YbjL